MTFDLLSTVEQGGCSAKLAPDALGAILSMLPAGNDPNLLVDARTRDDAGVYRINAQTAIIQTVDFFPPLCSDPWDFGRIAAVNALSDVYAMGGTALTAMNIVMFPSTRIPLDVLKAILAGGQEAVNEAGAVMIGGHTIDDYPPKYGLSVTGVAHPDRITTNAMARPGDVLVLTKPIGTGVIIAARRLSHASPSSYQAAIESMKQLNKEGAAIMRELGVRAATDITGFGLLGHGMQMALASGVSIRFHAGAIPLLEEAYSLADIGCIPAAAFRNLEYVEKNTLFTPGIDYNRTMLLADAQTSGGLLFCVDQSRATGAVAGLKACGYGHAAIVGEVTGRQEQALIIAP